MIHFAAVFIGGGIGCIMRYGISLLLMNYRVPGNFPLATLISNILATLLLAFLSFWFFHLRSLNDEWRLFWLVGVCGGFSTFSTFSIENWELARSGNYIFLILNILLNVGLCLLVIILTSRNALSE